MPASSTTWSRTSTSSSTSDASRRAGGGLDRLLGRVWLGHPFPSLLDGLATAGFVLLAGGGGPTALRLGAAMVCLQASIGALNDLRDAAADARSKPSKPLPSGRASRAEAWALTVLGFAAGVLLSAPSGLLAVALAVVGVACGYAYDLWFKRTPWSWLPLAIGLPLLPAYAWVGAGAGLPPGWPVLFPAAVLAGTALAISNALADADADHRAGLGTVVASLGPRLAWWLHAAMFVGVVGTAVATLAVFGVAGRVVPALISVCVGFAAIAAGAVLLRAPHGAERPRSPVAPASSGLGRFDRAAVAWGLEALGVAALGLGWLAGVAPAAP